MWANGRDAGLWSGEAEMIKCRLREDFSGNLFQEANMYLLHPRDRGEVQHHPASSA